MNGGNSIPKQTQNQIQPEAQPPAPTRPGWGLWHRRVCLVPTWRGWLLLLLLAGGLTVFGLHRVEPFLAANDPLPDGVPVVEGWVPDFALHQVIQMLRDHPGQTIYVTGGPIEIGGPLYQYKTLAELGASILRQMGLSASQVQPVPAPLVYKDRTFTSALALRDWFLAHGGIPAKINLISVGPHARRSRLLFQQVFGQRAQIGVTALTDPNYDAAHWWRTSQGVRTVTDELVAYGYARFLFFRSPE
jgi:hypothetical protein